MSLFISSVAFKVFNSGTRSVGKTAFRLVGTSGVVYICDIIQLHNHHKSRSISELIRGKLKDLQKLLKYINGITTFVSNALLSTGVLPIILALYLTDLFVIT